MPAGADGSAGPSPPAGDALREDAKAQAETVRKDLQAVTDDCKAAFADA